MNIILIGAGKIASKYINAFKTNNISVVALVDISENPFAKSLYPDVKLYKSLEDVPRDLANYVLISTPPFTHFQLAKKSLNLDYNVLIEKPAVLNKNELDLLLEIKNELNFITLLHWQYAKEVLYLKDYIDSNNIKNIDIIVNEPYAYNSKSKAKFKHLGGVYTDGLVNILSYLNLIINVNELLFIKKYDYLDSEINIVTKGEILYKYRDININIKFDWTKKNGRKKVSTFTLNNNSKVIVNHRLQSIKHQNFYKEFKTNDRLSDHYLGLFSSLNKTNDLDQTKILHNKLFEVIK